MSSYAQAGVDIDAQDEALREVGRMVRTTFTPGVLSELGSFGGLFRPELSGMKEPVLVSSADGVGTKLMVARMAGDYSTVGYDLVNHCVNDILVQGAVPLFFLDYVAMSHDDPSTLEQIVQGISDGCLQSDCALLGGETAIMPDSYQRGDYDLAGFCVGVAERKHLIDGQAIANEDVVIGVASSGLHSNGYSLVRKIAFDVGQKQADEEFETSGKTIGETLLTPTLIYTKVIRQVLQHYKVKNVVHGIAHITGGGLEENIARITPAGFEIEIDGQAWERSPVFAWLQRMGKVETEEMFRVFNMGIGLALIVSPYYAENVRRMLTDGGHENWLIGSVKTAKDVTAKSVTVRDK